MATAQDVIDRARQLINDVATGFVAGARWSDSELLDWISQGQREIVTLKPEANALTDAFAVTGGIPRQRLSPAVANRLIRVEANGVGAVAETGIVWLDETEPAITVSSGLSPTASYPLPEGSVNRLIVAACLVYGDTVGSAALGSITMTYGGVAMAMLERSTNQFGDTLDIGSVGNLFKIVVGVLSVNGQSFANSDLVVSDTSFYTGPNRKHFTLLTFDNVNPADADLSYGTTTFANEVSLGVVLPAGADVVAGEMLFSFGFTTEYNGSENHLVFTSSSGDPAGATQIPATLVGSNFIAVDINANERFLCARAGFVIASQDGGGFWARSSDQSSSGDETFGAVAFRVRPAG